ncbi:MAG: beta-ketoacyl-[acyl-carrier-protein] synthase family protein [bacterium]
MDKRRLDRRERHEKISFRDRRRFDRRMNLEEFKKLLFSGRKERIPGKTRIVITGIGVVAPNGTGKSQFWDSLAGGVSGIKLISMFDTKGYRSKRAGEISDFDPTPFLGKKGLRSLDRSTRLLNVAVKSALEDSAFEIGLNTTYDTGIVVGTTMGSVRSISEFDQSGLIDGSTYVNPALFPNTVINSPASQASIMFDIRGLNATVSSGFCSALNAAIYAYDSISLNRVNTILTGAVEELCHQTFLGFYRNNCLAASNPKYAGPEISMPFDKKRNGVVLGEGAGVLVLEEREHAEERGARIYGEILGFGYAFDSPLNVSKYHLRTEGAAKAMSQAMENSGARPEEIDLVCASANSSPLGDAIETQAIKEVFGKKAANTPITAVKSMFGEGYSVSGSFQMIAALLAINEGIIPPTVNYQEADPLCTLDYVPNHCRKAEIRRVMVNSFSPQGNHVSLIIGKI